MKKLYWVEHGNVRGCIRSAGMNGLAYKYPSHCLESVSASAFNHLIQTFITAPHTLKHKTLQQLTLKHHILPHTSVSIPSLDPTTQTPTPTTASKSPSPGREVFQM